MSVGSVVGSVIKILRFCGNQWKSEFELEFQLKSANLRLKSEFDLNFN